MGRPDDEVWVVNRLSDAVTIVSIPRRTVVATVQVGDEPADIVFAGRPERAFVTAEGDREALQVGLRAQRLPAGSVALIGDGVHGPAWVAASRLAGFVPASEYFGR